MLRPAAIEVVDALVHDLQSLNLSVRQFLLCDDDEVNIAVLIKIAYRKRALQAGGEEGVTQSILNGGY